MFGMGIWEIAVILVVALLVLGPEKLPKVAKQLGRGMREVRRAAAEFQHSLNQEVQELDDLKKTHSELRKEVNELGDRTRRAVIGKEPAAPSPADPRAANAVPTPEPGEAVPFEPTAPASGPDPVPDPPSPPEIPTRDDPA